MNDIVILFLCVILGMLPTGIRAGASSERARIDRRTNVVPANSDAPMSFKLLVPPKLVPSRGNHATPRVPGSHFDFGLRPPPPAADRPDEPRRA